MKRVYVNEKWCLGCHLCEYYCAFAQTDKPVMSAALKGVKIHPMIEVLDKGNLVHFAVNCRHCEEPYCVKGCISGALSLKDGVIFLDQEKCIGCYTCILTCPYGAISPTEDGSVVQKCELCIKNTYGTPQCVEHCPNAAIVFEDRG